MKLGKYELQEKIGEGGFGTVYKAVDTTLGRSVAVKVLHPQLMFDLQVVEKFRNEARSLAALEHPNVVTVHELGEEDGRVYIIMRYLAGGSLQNKLKKSKLPIDHALKILREVGSALEFAHGKGLTHRDIKPGNILFSDRDEAVLSDFGLAHAMQSSGATTSMAGFGTPEYMAPEQATKKETDLRVDIYSLGIVLYEMVTGNKPFEGETPIAVIFKHASEPIPDPRILVPDLPEVVEQAILKATAKNPEERFGSVAEMLAMLDESRKPKPEVKKEPALVKAKLDRVQVSQTRAEGERKAEIALDLGDGVNMTFVHVPMGEFLMGANSKVDQQAQVDEQPQHRVYLDEYWIGKTPVTNEQYNCYLGEVGLILKKIRKENLPVVEVSWHDAVRFCEWLTQKCGKNVQLPSEAQWEKAARGTDGRIYPWGNQKPNKSLAQYNSFGSSSVFEHPAGTSPYGALDMVGNVWQWVNDWYDKKYYAKSPSENPIGPPQGTSRVLRGGSWYSDEDSIRSSNRTWSRPVDANDYGFGFRCSLTA